MAKKDPLATQVWKAYARRKEVLPNGQRMENLTWRLMHLTLKKQEEGALPSVKEEVKDLSIEFPMELPILPGILAEVPAQTQQQQQQQQPQPDAEAERGRSKGKSRVVGFQQQKEATPEAE
jgi:GATA-binding protein